MTKQEILIKLHNELPALKKRYPIRRLGLFGSFAREEQGPESDIDILTEVDPVIGLGFIDLADDLEKILGHKVDLISMRSLKSELKKEVEKELIDA